MRRAGAGPAGRLTPGEAAPDTGRMSRRRSKVTRTTRRRTHLREATGRGAVARRTAGHPAALGDHPGGPVRAHLPAAQDRTAGAVSRAAGHGVPRQGRAGGACVCQGHQPAPVRHPAVRRAGLHRPRPAAPASCRPGRSRRQPTGRWASQHQDRGLVLFIFPEIADGAGRGRLWPRRAAAGSPAAATAGNPPVARHGARPARAGHRSLHRGGCTPRSAATGPGRRWPTPMRAAARRAGASSGATPGATVRRCCLRSGASTSAAHLIERFILLVLAAPVTAFALLAAVALYALQDALRQRVAGWRQGRGPCCPPPGANGSRWGWGWRSPASVCPSLVFVFAMGPEWLTRLGRFGGAGVSLTWPVG